MLLQRCGTADSVIHQGYLLVAHLPTSGVAIRLYGRGERDRGGQEITDSWLQLRVLEDALDYNGDPDIVALLTGNGAGYEEGRGFHSTLERMHQRGWRMEVLSWTHSCRRAMREWDEANDVFIALDAFYESIAFREPSRPGHELAEARDALPLNLSQRPIKLGTVLALVRATSIT